MLLRAIALALCLGSTALPAAAVTPVQAPIQASKTMSTAELMAASALDQIFETYAETIAASPDSQGVTLPAPFLSAWRGTALEVFEASILTAELARAIDGKLSEPDLVVLSDFFHSDFGKQITGIESAVPEMSVDEQLAALDEGAAILEGLAPDATRVRQIDEIMALVSAEISRSMVGASMRAMLASMSMAGPSGDIEVPWEEIDAQLAQIMPGVEAEVLASQRALMAYAYRELSDDGLETYVEFLRTDASQRFYVVVGNGVGAIMTGSMSRFGERLAARLNQVNV